MGNKVFVNGISSISVQEEFTWGKGFLEVSEEISRAHKPDFKKYIKPAALRRMSPAIKMGLSAGKMALEDAKLEMPDAIITGTGQGCKRDTERFLTEMESGGEVLLSPTSFIQSTHNTLAGQMALHIKCRGYNITYTQNSASLELALQDALMQLQEKSAKNILTGGVEEISELITGFMAFDGQLKKNHKTDLLDNRDLNTPNLVSNQDVFSKNYLADLPQGRLLQSKTPGTFFAEGSQFFVLSSEKNKNNYAELKDLTVKYRPENMNTEIQTFLAKNDLELSDIDTLILGNNGDFRFDNHYHTLQQGIFKETLQLGFKQFSGEYDTASGFAVWAACRILKSGIIPSEMKLNKKSVSKIKNILIYNQYLGKNHSLILLSGL